MNFANWLLCEWIILSAIFCNIALIKSEVFLWPQPQSVTWGSGPAITLDFAFRIETPNHYELEHAARRYERLIFNELWSPIQDSITQEQDSITQEQEIENSNLTKSLYNLVVEVSDLTADLQHGVNEAYDLYIPDDGHSGKLAAFTVWGALHGLETFSQLVRYTGVSEGAGVLILEHGVQITDRPLYPYRGLTVDTSRNFFPVKDILRTIDALSYNKLNVLHWHITDSQSFPIELSKEPELARKGSYGPKFTYSHKDVEKIIKYARSRGVRIIPEIDVPGHTASWGAAYPDIVTCRDQYWYYSDQPWSERLASEPTPGQLNPLKDETYTVVKNVIHDVASLFPDNFYHSGGDEIAPNCWNQSEDIRKYLTSGESASSLLQKFMAITQPYITSQNKTAVYWEDVLLNAAVNVTESMLPKDSVILETWNNGPLNTKRLTSSGYRTIVASSDFYYLDCGRGDFLGNDTRVDEPINTDPDGPSYNYGGDGGSWCAPYKTWQRIYDYDITYNLTEEEAKLVLGGEVSLWSEQIDATVMDGLVWPRASAMAEALWSGNRGSDGRRRSVEALVRLNEWRYRMVGRGIGAAPLQPMWCLRDPDQCNLK